jgi:hypothetical protein
MHVTTTTIWESELHRQDLLTMAGQQRRAIAATAQGVSTRPSAQGQSIATLKIAARYTRYLLTSLASVAIGMNLR